MAVMVVYLECNGNPVENREKLQQALDLGGTVHVQNPGTYDVSGTLFIDDHTSLLFDPGITIKRSDAEAKNHPFIVNRGTFTNKWNHNIRIEGLHLITNHVDPDHFSIYPGLRGHLAFLRIRDLVIRDYECLDLTKLGYGIHVCSFENLLFEQLHIEGDKDGVHLSDGRNFVIRDSRIGTSDDGIALNAYDYSLSTATYGWVENGVVENCYDLDVHKQTGNFCRMLGGCWTDWYSGMIVQNSTLAVYDGHLYSVALPLPPIPHDPPLTSTVPPTHKEGIQEFGGIPWRYVKPHNGEYEASCRNIAFRNIHLQKPRFGFGFTFEQGLWAESVPKGMKMPVISNLLFENIIAECDLMYVFGGLHPAVNIQVNDSVLSSPTVIASVVKNQKPEDYPLMDFTFRNVTYRTSAGYTQEVAPGRKILVKQL